MPSDAKGCLPVPSRGAADVISWDDSEPHARLSENASLTERPGKFKPDGQDAGGRLGSPAHFADGNAEAQRGEGPLGMQVGTGRCRLCICVPGLPA